MGILDALVDSATSLVTLGNSSHSSTSHDETHYDQDSCESDGGSWDDKAGRCKDDEK